MSPLLGKCESKIIHRLSIVYVSNRCNMFHGGSEFTNNSSFILCDKKICGGSMKWNRCQSWSSAPFCGKIWILWDDKQTQTKLTLKPRAKTLKSSKLCQVEWFVWHSCVFCLSRFFLYKRFRAGQAEGYLAEDKSDAMEMQRMQRKERSTSPISMESLKPFNA